MIKQNEDITIKKIPELQILSIKYQGKYSECGIYMGQLFKIAKGNFAGQVFNRYLDEGYKEGNANIEVCISIKKRIDTKDAEYKILPPTKVISTIHIGPYDQVGNAYKRLLDYKNENNIEFKEPCREIYIKGPGMIFRGNPKKYITEVQFPIS